LEAAEEKIDRVSRLPSALGTWINFFYYSHLKSEGEMTTLLQDQPIVQQAYGQYRQFNQNERLRALDEAHQRFLHDHATDVEEAHEKGVAIGVDKGMAIGVDKGIEIGMDKGKVEIARNMRSEGFDVDIISRMTGLSAIEIDRLN
jgi:predicted transposase/invertase (TIGR01784 family)